MAQQGVKLVNFSSSCDKIPAQSNLRKDGLKSWQKEIEEAGGAVSSSRKHSVVNASFLFPASFLLSPGTTPCDGATHS